jgi:hypothetical protein
MSPKLMVFAAQEGAQQRLFLGVTNFLAKPNKEQSSK